MQLQREMRRAYRHGSFKIQLAKFAVEFGLAKGKERTPLCHCPQLRRDCSVEHYDTDTNRIYQWQKIICARKCIRMLHDHVFSLARIDAIVRRRSSKYYFTAPFQHIHMTVSDTRAVSIAPYKGGPGSIPDQPV